jgi:hypothetical protein
MAQGPWRSPLGTSPIWREHVETSAFGRSGRAADLPGMTESDPERTLRDAAGGRTNTLCCLNHLDGIVREECAWQSVTAKYVFGQCANLILGGGCEHRVDSLMRAIENSTVDHAGSSGIKYGARQHLDAARLGAGSRRARSSGAGLPHRYRPRSGSGAQGAEFLASTAVMKDAGYLLARS